MPISRRQIIQGGMLMAAAAAANVAGSSPLESQSDPQPQPKKVPDRGPRLDDDLVREFVGAGHGNLEKVKEMLAQQPALINATWDWGGGDWETGLGAAAHMGERDIALFLLERGARLDVFAAAMLGYVDVVRGILTEQPETAESLGPHGIPLLVHAQKGGHPARAVVELLEAHIGASR